MSQTAAMSDKEKTLSEKERCLPFLFEAQVVRHPDASALSLNSVHLTYRELNARANQLAGYLREQGIGPESLVALHLDRSFNLIVGIWAILKAGGAYVPLDLACPEDRLLFMLKDSACPVLLTERKLAGRFAGYAGKLVCLDEIDSALERYATTDVETALRPENLAYVIYTSGSTGTPKGVLVTHDNVARLFSATDAWFNFGPQDVWTLFHSCAFDFSVWEIYGALLYGGRLVIVPYEISRSAESFHELLVREKVTVLNQTPSAFRQLVQADRKGPKADLALRYIIYGGEALEFQSLAPWFERYGDQRPQCVNMYGITETTVHVTYRPITLADVQAGSGSNIGIPIPDLHVYVVNPAGSRVDPGVEGEMLVGGRGLARGYLNRPELTTERFIPNPFEPEVSPRLYRTGDSARQLPNGDLEYLGRIDQQVKIRGFRIELNEIEARLARHAGVTECAVLARVDKGGEPRLVAYLVPEPGGLPTIESLRAHVAEKLPAYMVPAAYVFLGAFPLTMNGKLDREKLPAPSSERPRLAVEFVAPQAGLEEKIAQLWRVALRLNEVGSSDNLFDLGADSLMVTAVHREMQGVLDRKIAIIDLFEFPTIAALARKLEGQGAGENVMRDKVQNRAELQRAALAKARRPSVPAVKS
jgi:amino acid adenylation domain-containing protein